jgi:hypothetical protein
MHKLRVDLVPSVADPPARLLLGRILAAERGPGPMTGWESGRVTLRVDQVVRGADVRPGDTLTVPFDRLADEQNRDKNPVNHWNLLPLARGDLLLLACRPVPDITLWHADAAMQVAAPQDPAVAELGRACQLEEFRGPAAEKVRQFAEAFTRPNTSLTDAGVLRRYVLHALDDRGVLERHDGVEVIARALASDAVAPAERVEVADHLTSDRFFRPEFGADAVNQRVVALLTRGLLAEADPDRRKRWSYLLSLVLLRRFSPDDARDRDARRALIRATGTPPPPAVADLLARQAEEEEEGDRKDTLKLLTAWRAAAAP